MPWSNLPTNYADATWEGARKYTINLGTSGGTYQNCEITDETSYTPDPSGGNYFYGANDANQTNNAINKIVTALGGDVDNLAVGIAYGGTGATTAAGARTNLELLKATNLYYNASGTSGTITLSEACENFAYIEIYFTDGTYKSSVKYYVNSDKAVTLNTYNIWSGDNKYIYWRYADITFSQSTVTWGKNSWVYNENGTWGGADNAGQIKIYRIDGYSY